MSNADLSIKVGVDNADLLTGMERSKKSLQDFADQAKRFQQQLKTATDPQSIIRLNQALTASNERMKQIKSVGTSVQSGFSSMSKGANTAGQSLTNLGRIAQDAPFGFIGIQNNLNPLLESFQRLKAETGSAGGALKALGSSMLGAGGIGLALSVVSAGILFFQSGLFSFGENSKKAAAAAKEFADSLDEAKSSAISSGLQLQTYADIAADTNQSLETRNVALEKANKIMGEHGEKLTLVNVATKGAREEIEKFTQATIQQALASKFADKAADIIIARKKAFKEMAAAREALNKVAPTKVNNELTDNGIFAYGQALSSTLKISKAQVEYNEKLKIYEGITRSLADITNDLNKSQEESARLFGEIGTKVPDEKKIKDVRDINDVLNELALKTKELSAEEDFLGIDKSKEKISAIQSALKELVVKFKVDPKDTVIQKLLGDIKDLTPGKYVDLFFAILPTSEQIKKEAERIAKEFNDSLGKYKMKSKLEIQGGIGHSDKKSKYQEDAEKEAAAVEKTWEGHIENLNSIINTTLSDSVSTFAEGIADAISGTGSIGDVFGNVFKIIGSGLQSMGKAMIAYGFGISALKEAIKNPYLAIAAGVGLVILGKLMQNSIPQFADGVTNFGGGMAVVGERGPELVRLPKGSDVIPNGRVNGMSPMGAQVFIPAITLRGNDLVMAFNRASQTISRTG